MSALVTAAVSIGGPFAIALAGQKAVRLARRFRP